MNTLPPPATSQPQLVRRAPAWWKPTMLWGNVTIAIIWLIGFVVAFGSGASGGDVALGGATLVLGGFFWTAIVWPLWGLANLGMAIAYLATRRYELVPPGTVS